MIGIDIVEVDRIKDKLDNQSFMRGVFASSELEYYHNNNKSVATLAGLYAAKEAYLKACGSGIDRHLNQVVIQHNNNGQPYYAIENASQCRAELSISHTDKIAIAVCVLY